MLLHLKRTAQSQLRKIFVRAYPFSLNKITVARDNYNGIPQNRAVPLCYLILLVGPLMMFPVLDHYFEYIR